MLVYACNGQAQMLQKQPQNSPLHCETAKLGARPLGGRGNSSPLPLTKLTGEMFSVKGSVLFSTPDLNW